jgi:tetratricopeptide (TPR) repeat protein
MPVRPIRLAASNRPWSKTDRLLAAALIALSTTTTWPAFAQTPPSAISPTDEAAAISLVAAAKSKAGEFALCASMYRQAYKLDPGFLGYLYSIARCSQKAGDLDAAERDYRAFLARAPQGEPLGQKARANLDEILAARSKQPVPDELARPAPPPAPPTPTAVPPVSATPPPAAPGPPPERWKAWTLAGTGGALAVVGASVGWSGTVARQQLRDELSVRENGLVTAMTPAEAHEREGAARITLFTGMTMVALGVVGVGLGVAWLRADSSQVSAAVAPGGVAVAWSWR